MVRNKAQHHNKSPLGNFPSHDARFFYVHLDVVSPLSQSSGYPHLITCVDQYTHWADAIHFLEREGLNHREDLRQRWVTIFGFPSTVPSLSLISSKLCSISLAARAFERRYACAFPPRVKDCPACRRRPRKLVRQPVPYNPRHSRCTEVRCVLKRSQNSFWVQPSDCQGRSSPKPLLVPKRPSTFFAGLICSLSPVQP
uniref:Integrase catalytic domain-containing protein n=1 Tax=Schistocephalus solidus TaxID=70667 RepID=A0A183T269_SCHSO